jgi:hypothetical protein
MKSWFRVSLCAATTLMLGVSCGPELRESSDDQAAKWAVSEASRAPICMPRALAYQPPGAPELPREVFEACPLQTISWTYPSHPGANQSVTYVRNGDHVTHIVENASREETQRTTYALENGRPVVIENTQHFRYYGRGKQVRRWEFDEEDRLVAFRERTFSGEGLTHDTVIAQTWDDDRLVERRKRISVHGQDTDLTYRWQYDGFRLVSATITDVDDTVVHSVEWTYTATGLPASVRRRVREADVLVQTWVWSDEDELLGREVLLDAGGVRAGDVALGAGHLTHTVDDFAPGIGHNGYGYSAYQSFLTNPWPDAHDREVEGCVRPPTSLGHGYPDEEPEYHLGWSADDRPSGMGFAYGYQGYGWGYGDAGWFSHDRVASTLWPGVAEHLHRTLVFAIDYDARGRMVREAIDVIAADASNTRLERTRTFESDQMREDRVVVRRPNDEVVSRFMIFERDEKGAIIERRLYHEDLELSRHEWVRDERGEVLVHEIHERLFDWTYTHELFSEVPDTDTELFTLSSFARDFDERGNLIKDQRVHQTHASTSGSHLQHRYDAADRIVETLHFNGPEQTLYLREVFEYDEQGRLIFQGSHGPGTDEFTTYEEHQYDSRGRLLESNHVSGNYRQSESRQYTCDG